MQISISKRRKLIREASLPFFAAMISNNKWIVKPHLLAIAYNIYKLLNTESLKVLIVNMPPRHGKSELISKYLPAWFLLNYPDKKVILTTYSDTFSEMFGRQAQDLYIKYMKYYGTGLYSRRQSAGEWYTNHGGCMLSVGAGGGITGKGGHLVLIDDPVKNFQEAMSETNKENLQEWLYTTIMTRLEPGGKIVLIMTRWQPDDLTGNTIDKLSEDKYIHLKMKGIATKKEFFRNAGEALWPERYSLKELNEQKEMITPYWFNCMYQQEPKTKGGELIDVKKFNYYDEDENHLYCHEKNMVVRKIFTTKLATVDLGISQKATADYTVQLIFRVDPDSNVFIEKVIREKLPPDKHEEIIQDTFYTYGLKTIGIETVAYQEVLIQRLLSKGISVFPLKPDKDKYTRVVGMLPYLGDGRIYIKRGQPWEEKFIDELRSFPNVRHDDQVDAFSYIAYFINMQKKVNIGSGSMMTSHDKYQGF